MNPEHPTAGTESNNFAAALSSKCVLLVEDDASVRRFLEVTLRRYGYQVITAEDGVQGMKRALTTRFDLVITDAIMPQISGHELARLLRANPKLAKVPIVLLTAQENNRTTADRKLIDACLYKPVKTEELKRCLARLLRDS